MITVMVLKQICDVTQSQLSDGFLDDEVSREKIIGQEPDETQICTNETHSIIVLIVCKIRTQSSRGQECLLRYQDGGAFDHQCGSKFSLITKNQTVFLLLTSLTPVDGGSYTCECSTSGGSFILHLNVSVTAGQGEAAAPHKWIILLLSMMVPLIILGCFYRRLKRKPPESQSNPPDEESEPIEPYSTFIQKENQLYSNHLT